MCRRMCCYALKKNVVLSASLNFSLISYRVYLNYVIHDNFFHNNTENVLYIFLSLLN